MDEDYSRKRYEEAKEKVASRADRLLERRRAKQRKDIIVQAAKRWHTAWLMGDDADIQEAGVELASVLAEQGE